MKENQQRIGFGTRFFAYLLDTLIIVVLEFPLFYLLLFLGASAGGAIGAGAGSMQGEAGATVVGGIFGAVIGSFGVALVGMLGFIPLYFALEIFKGYTPGKYLLGIKIYDENRQIPTRKAATWRFALKSSYFILLTLSFLMLFIVPVLYFILGMAAFVIGSITVLGYFAALGAKKQALHDRWSRTAVYRRIDIKY